MVHGLFDLQNSSLPKVNRMKIFRILNLLNRVLVSAQEQDLIEQLDETWLANCTFSTDTVWI